MTRVWQNRVSGRTSSPPPVSGFEFRVSGCFQPKTRNAKRETSVQRGILSSVTIFLFAAAFGISDLCAQDYLDKPAPQKVPEVAVPLTPEEKTQLAAVDARLAAVEALVAKLDEPVFRKSTLSAIADLKKRRAALEKKFDPASYETLMHQVIGRYQVVQLWLKPPRTPAAADGKSASQ